MSHVWKHKGYFKLFLSHLTNYKVFARDLKISLYNYGISAFVAHEDIEPTREWQDTIESALHSADAFVALLHPDFYKSKWCDQEIGIAIGKEMPLVSVRIGADPHGFIGKYQAIQGLEKSTVQLSKKIWEVFKINDDTHDKLAFAAVNRLLSADSWAKAKSAMDLVEDFDCPDETTCNLLASAVESNGEVKSAFGVPARIDSTLRKWYSK